MDHHPEHEHPAPGDVEHGWGYETRDASPRALMIYGMVLTIVLVVVHFALLGAYRFMGRRRLPEPSAQPAINIYEQLRMLRQSEERTLGEYRWIDRHEGVVRIPIERAIDLVAERGVPKGKGPRTEAEVNSHHGIPAKPEAPAKAEKKHQTDQPAREKSSEKPERKDPEK